jgi:CBS domain-containing protein
MKDLVNTDALGRLTLWAETAADLMTPDAVSIGEGETVKEAIAFLTDKGFSAAPVIDSAGRPVGVLSQSDILVFDREKVEYVPAIADYYERADLTNRSGEALVSGFQVENVDRTWVRDIMTPVVFSVSPDAPVRRVVEDLLALKVNRLFVVGSDGVLVGVISAFDVLRHLAVVVDPATVVSTATPTACEALCCR